VHIVLSAAGARVRAETLDDALRTVETVELDRAALPDWAWERERDRPRWTWDATSAWYPPLLAAGVRVERAHDLRLARAILRHAPAARLDAPADDWDRPAHAADPDDALFALDAPVPLDAAEELRRQRAAVEAGDDAARLGFLLTVESVGSLVAAELQHAGIPWSRERHDAILRERLGDPPGPFDAATRPARMEQLLAELRAALGDPEANPDSPVELVKSLQRAGIRVSSTRKWELERIEHPVIAPLLAYKRMARLLSANGWHWLDEWVRDGRFHPVYVVGGVVTGRWAASGGGALQLPREVRGAVVADPGWRLVVADAAQLEPRVLAAMSGDAAMARAGQDADGRPHDMYQGMVASGAVETRSQAKYGMLGAIYGGTTGESARVLPRIRRAFPRAMALVEEAARAGERGESVRTWLGRGSPARTAGPSSPDAAESLTEAEQRRRQSDARAWGRFTRNFVVQGTAAEWAMCWMGAVRRRLRDHRAELVFFLHDELVVHAPAEEAEEVAAVLRESAAEAGRLMFGAAPVQFALSVAIVESYADAK